MRVTAYLLQQFQLQELFQAVRHLSFGQSPPKLLLCIGQANFICLDPVLLVIILVCDNPVYHVPIKKGRMPPEVNRR